MRSLLVLSPGAGGRVLAVNVYLVSAQIAIDERNQGTD